MKSLPLKNKHYINLQSDFIKYIHTMGYARNRDNEYGNAVWEFFVFLERNNVREIKYMKNAHVVAYHQHLSNRNHFYKNKRLSASTIYSQFNGIRLLFHHLVLSNKIDGIPSHVYKLKRPEMVNRQIVTQEEVKLMYAASDNYTEIALLCCAYGCGLRQSEILQLSIRDINLTNRTLLVRKGKFGKSRIVPLTKAIADYFKKYIHIIRSSYCKDNDKLFIHKNGRNISGMYLNKLIRKIIERTKDSLLREKHITLHCLRHSIATHMVDNGAGIDFVRQFLGHQDINTTNRYAIQRKRNNQLLKKLFV